MARCPRCARHFKVLEDEDPADHGCPRCGFTGRKERCLWCGHDIDEDDDHPYCSRECAVKAELDSEEDSCLD